MTFKVDKKLPMEKVALRGCEICGDERRSVILVGRDYRFGLKEPFSFVQCDGCGLIYLNPRPSEKILSQLYIDCYPSLADGDEITRKTENPQWNYARRFWHKLSGNYSEHVIDKAKGRVLDVGCGWGKFLWRLKQDGIEAYGIEGSRKHEQIHKRLGLRVYYESLEDANFPDNYFDTVIMSQVIEHLPAPKQTLGEIKRVLAQGGRVLIYCPNSDGYLRRCFGRYWHGWHIPFHLYVFSNASLKRLADKVGLRVNAVSGITPDDFLSTSLNSYFFGERGNGGAIRGKRLFDSLIFRASASPFLRLLDFILKGKEDCLEVELVKQ